MESRPRTYVFTVLDGPMNWKDLVYRQIIAYCNEIGSRTFSLDGYFRANADIFCKAYPNNGFPRQKVCGMLQRLRDKGLLTFLNNTGSYTLRGIDLLNAEQEEIKTIDISNELPEKREYLVETYVRHVAWARRAREVFGCYCLVDDCNNTFLRDDGPPYIEVHHIIPLFKNGENSLPDLSVVCAHHHKMAHFADRATKSNIGSMLLSITKHRLEAN